MKGRIRGQAMATTTGPGAKKGALLYTLACTVKSRPGHADTLRPKEEEKKKEKELVVLPELGCLATFIGYVSRVSACPCQGRYPPHHNTFAPGDCPCDPGIVHGNMDW